MSTSVAENFELPPRLTLTEELARCKTQRQTSGRKEGRKGLVVERMTNLCDSPIPSLNPPRFAPLRRRTMDGGRTRSISSGSSATWKGRTVSCACDVGTARQQGMCMALG